MTSSSALARLMVTLLFAGLFVPMAFADGGLSLAMEPHCAEFDRTNCPVFDVANATHLATKQLNVGDVLDIDVVLTGASGRNVETVRSWLKYDAAVLEARSVELTSAIPEPIPDEQTIDPLSGLVKIGGNTAGSVSTNRLALARVTFRVTSATANTVITFHNFKTDGTGQTSVNGVVDARPAAPDQGLGDLPCIGDLIGCREAGPVSLPLLSVEPSALTVTLTAPSEGTANAAEISSSSQSSLITSSSSTSTPLVAAVIPAVTQSSSSSVMKTGSGSTFTLLQIQNVRVTSNDHSIFLSWQALKSSDLAGYNVYYGTVSGKYIQRRSIPATSASLVIRDLTLDTPYFLAVRGYNALNQETIFSREVSVTVGKPETSTSPLTASVGNIPGPDGNPVEKRGGTSVSGTTGTDSTLLILVLVSAMIGTGFAAHRQFSLSRFTHA